MPQVSISGISINFPFDPYDVQKKYMEKVIECLQKAVHGVLESPTGTGKTLCLLCATLAWQEIRKAQQQALASNVNTCSDSDLPEFKTELYNNITAGTGVLWGDCGLLGIPKIIYSSRTHSQLSQAVQELKRSHYKYVKACVIGSRDQLCIHPDVLKESNSNVKIHMCRAKVSNRTCHFYNSLESNVPRPTDKQNTVVDIEDLVNIGKKTNCCPYYLSRGMKQEADMVFMPYNYLLDSKARKTHGVELAGNVVIFDEAHNVEKMCEESASFELSSLDIAMCISEVTQIMNQKAVAEQTKGSNFDMTGDSSEPNVDVTLNELCILKTLFCMIEEYLDEIPLQGENHSATFPGSYIFQFLDKVELNAGNSEVILEILDRLIHFLNAGISHPSLQRGNGLQRFADMIKVIFNKDRKKRLYFDNSAASYKVHVRHSDLSKRGQKHDIWTATKAVKQARTLNFWCFNPGIGMQTLLEESPRCVLLTSGTLSPLDTFTSELQISLPIRLENPHIIKKQQLWVGVIPTGPDGSTLNSSYHNRSTPQYISSLGNAIVNYARIVPKGLLVFFPSYYVMNECKKNWETSNVWQSIGNYKTLFMETQNRHEMAEVMDEFYKKNSEKDSRGGAFLAVCRGKVSEGLDFADNNGRAVIITGLPFPPWKDPKVTLKMQYLDDLVKTTKSGSSGQEWYRLEASRAVNQAVGRVIRHKDDFGAIILCDNRFGDKSFQSQLSAWLRPHVQNFPNFGASIKSLVQFFKQTSTMEKTLCRTSTLSVPDVNMATVTSSSIANAGNSINSSKNIMHAVSSDGSQTMRLKPKIASKEDDALDWANKTIEYLTPQPQVSTKFKSKSLFGALEEHENTVPNNAKQGHDQKRIFQSSESGAFQGLTQVVKKRKFNVVKPQQSFGRSISPSGSGSDAPGSVASGSEISKPLASTSFQETANYHNVFPPSGTCSAPSSTSVHSEDKGILVAEEFQKNIKKHVSSESYRKFKSSLKKFSKDFNVKDMMDTLVSIGPIPEIMKILPGFRNFVPMRLKREFDDYLAKITKEIETLH